eukprot:185844-Rhodomonas_salina.1
MATTQCRGTARSAQGSARRKAGIQKRRNTQGVNPTTTWHTSIAPPRLLVPHTDTSTPIHQHEGKLEEHGGKHLVEERRREIRPKREV